MRKWLRCRLAEIRSDIVYAYLYGSIVDPNTKPRDIDVVIVTCERSGSGSWNRTRAFSKELRREFVDTFRLPLSVMIVTKSEWNEVDGTIVRERIAVI